MALNPTQFMDLAEQLIPQNRPFLVTGPPGIGKTDCIKQVAKNLDRVLFVSMPAIDAPEDYKGFGFFYEGKADFYPMGMLREIMECPAPAIWFFDDAGQAPIAVQNAYMQLIHPRSRMLNNQKIPDNISIVAASNGREHNAGVVGMTDPLKGRFTTIVELAPDMKSWVTWAVKNNINPLIIGYLHYSPNKLCQFEPSRDFDQSPTPRGWESLSELMKLNIPKEMNHECFKGAVGKAAAAEFIGFCEILAQLPDLDSIERNGSKAAIPSNNNGNYAVTGALAARGTTKETLKEVCAYMNRLPTEYRVLWSRIWAERNPTLLESEPWTKWIADNGTSMAV